VLQPVQRAVRERHERVVVRRDPELPVDGPRVDVVPDREQGPEVVEHGLQRALHGVGALGGDHPAARAHEDRVVELAPQPRERTAGRALRDAQALRGRGDVALLQQGHQRQQQVEVVPAEVLQAHGRLLTHYAPRS
jgi:hypothetical protein